MAVIVSWIISEDQDHAVSEGRREHRTSGEVDLTTGANIVRRPRFKCSLRGGWWPTRPEGEVPLLESVHDDEWNPLRWVDHLYQLS